MKTHALILAGALTASTLAIALDTPKSGYIMPGLNTMKADSDWNADDRLVGGSLKLGAQISQYFDIQAGLALARAQNASAGISYKQESAGLDALWMLSRKSLRPFLLAGLGAENDKLQTPTRKANGYAPYVNAGAGVQWALDKDALLQADLRYQVGKVNADRWDQDYSRNLIGHVGMGFNFGNAAKAAPTATPAPTMAPKPTATPRPTIAPTVVPTATPAPTATAVPTAAPTATPVPKLERITLSASSLFAIGQAKLGADKSELNKLATALKDHPEAGSIQINGYTDPLGNEKANQALSQKRADAVKTYLVSQGVPADRLKAVGKGSADPVAKCEGIKKRTELVNCLAPNRRIEVEPVTIQKQVK